MKKRDMTIVLGIGAPPPKSGKPAMPPMPGLPKKTEAYGLGDEQAMEHEMAESPSTERAEHGLVRITPEAVSYRTPEEVCGGCEYHGDDDHCAVLEMTVDPQAGCNAYEPKKGAMEALHEGETPEQEAQEVA